MMENEPTIQKKINLLTKRSSNYMSLKHVKSLIVLVVGLLAVGCGKTEPIKELTPEQKQKALRDSVVGEYEFKDENGNPYTFVFLENGVREYYLNGKKRRGNKWSIVDGEIYIE